MFKKPCFHNLILHFLTKVLTCLNDIGAYFIEYVLNVISCELIFPMYLRLESLNLTETYAKLKYLRWSLIFKITQSIFQFKS